MSSAIGELTNVDSISPTSNHFTHSVVIVTCVYPPEPNVSAKTSSQLAAQLTKAGCEVRVITGFPSRPGGKLHTGFSRRFPFSEVLENGIRVTRCYSVISAKSTVLSRFLENITFGLTSGLKLLTMRRPSAIYANSWPLFASGLVMLVAKLRRIPIAISVQDIYPESIVVQGRISENGVIMRALRFLDTLIANSANVLIVISDTFLRLYRDTRGIDASKISVIHNWYDDDSVPSPQGVEQFRADRGIGPSDFLLVFAGNIGAAAGVEQVIDAFAYFDRATSLRLLVAGEGSELARCQQRAAPYGSRIVFETPWHSRDSGKVLHAANLFILPTQGEQSKYSLPSKLLYYMLAGRPVLALATHDSELATIMQQSNCGWVIEPHRPDLFASTVSKLLECSAEELDSRGKSGLQYVTEHFSSRTCLSRLLRLIQELSCG